jgi:hypothetical protein
MLSACAAIASRHRELNGVWATVPHSVDDKDHFDVLDSKAQQAAQLAKTDSGDRHGGRVPGAAGHHGWVLRAPRWLG